MKLNRFAGFAWGVLAYNLAVILWGAYVRASGSGAGCGDHWPKCNGQIIPRPEQIETLIEFSHRVTTAFSGLLVIAMVVWAYRAFAKGSPVRLGAVLSFVFVLIEGLVGAVQVRLGLTGDNASVGRAVIGSIHLVNTFLLIAAMLLTAWWASGGRPLRLRGQGWMGGLLLGALVLMLLLGATGAVTALGDTLFPAETLHEGLMQDLDPTAHFLIRLRIYHPMLAIGVGIYTVVLGWLARTYRPSRSTVLLSYALTGVFLLQLVVGAVNVYLLAPIWMQLFHLLMAQIVWLALVLLGAEILAEQPDRLPATVPAVTPARAG
ncbi:MAG TPA: COX15/CtaA family protein [Roseiflexaceae bacterium]|nr:COX15/CtaA family protein [Roseiflexaceae bacterium]